MKKKIRVLALTLMLSGLLLINTKSYAHCEIPCGIYGDSVRIALIKEHIQTIEKSMKMIKEISASTDPDQNQLVRWVMNKEEHAIKLQEIVSQYFLHQRIKITDPSDVEAYKKYQLELELLHKLTVYAMKAKQTTDEAFIDKLRSTIALFEESYFHTHKH